MNYRRAGRSSGFQSGPPPLALQLLLQEIDHLPDARVDFHSVLYQSARMEDGAVIAAAKRLTNRIEGALRQLAGEEHGNLAGESDILRAALAGHVGQADVEMLGHLLLDRLD